MVLVFLAVCSLCQDIVVGKIFEVQSYFTFQQPHEWIYPKGNGKQFCKENVYGMSLPAMCQFVCHYLVDFLSAVLRWVDENPVEERERSLVAFQQIHLCAIYIGCFALCLQSYDRSQLPQKAQQQQANHHIIYNHCRGFPVHCASATLCYGYSWQDNGSIFVCHRHHSHALVYPIRAVQSRHQHRNKIHSDKCCSAPREECIARKHQLVKAEEYDEGNV